MLLSNNRQLERERERGGGGGGGGGGVRASTHTSLPRKVINEGKCKCEQTTSRYWQCKGTNVYATKQSTGIYKAKGGVVWGVEGRTTEKEERRKYTTLQRHICKILTKIMRTAKEK